MAVVRYFDFEGGISLFVVVFVFVGFLWFWVFGIRAKLEIEFVGWVRVSR